MRKLVFILLTSILTSCITVRPKHRHPHHHKIITLVVVNNLQTSNQNNTTVYNYKAVKVVNNNYDTVTLHTLQSYKVGDKILIPISND
jgi:hypothetical protein